MSFVICVFAVISSLFNFLFLFHEFWSFHYCNFEHPIYHFKNVYFSDGVK